jgi:hypothetical protein
MCAARNSRTCANCYNSSLQQETAAYQLHAPGDEHRRKLQGIALEGQHLRKLLQFQLGEQILPHLQFGAGGEVWWQAAQAIFCQYESFNR